MRVLVTGGRTFLDIPWMHGALDLLDQTLPGGITEIIEGGAPGADIRARWWAERENVAPHALAGFNRIKVTEMKADWNKHGKAAGAIRNHEMAKLGPDVVLACPGNTGTRHMVETAKKMGLKVVYLEKMPVQRSERSLDDTSQSLL